MKNSNSPEGRGESLCVVAVGANTPVGRSAWSTAAAARAGIAGFCQHPFVVDSVGEPVRLAMAPWLDAGMRLSSRMEELLFPSIDEALSPLAAGSVRGVRLRLMLGLPGPRPGLNQEGLERSMSSAISQRYRGVFQRVEMFSNGHAAGLIGIEAAARHLESGGVDACVVAAVDSYVDPETLEWLEECEQIHGAGDHNNAWGFIPGEAAGAVLCASRSTARRLALKSLVRLLSVGRGTETKLIKTQTICLGEGLSDAFRQALGALQGDAKVTDIYCDMNGEPYRADEYGFSALRMQGQLTQASDFVAPAAFWGDVGAAHAPLCIALSAIAGAKGYANGEHALIWASSESGERAAALLHVGREI